MAHRSSPPATGPGAGGGAGALTLGVICGMEAEARALGRWACDARLAVAVSGGRPDRAEAAARRLASRGVRALLSWGIAGALDPALAPGALIAAGRVVGPDGTIYALASAAAGIARAPGDDRNSRVGELAGDPGSDMAPPLSRGRAGKGAAARSTAGAASPHPPTAGPLLAGSDTIVLDPAAKTALRRGTGAVAVDMESHRVAAVAAEAGLPCYVIRAVSDPARRALPALAATALGPDGRPRPGAVLAGLVRRPGDLVALLHAARDSRAAVAALRRAAGPALGAMLEALPEPPPSRPWAGP